MTLRIPLALGCVAVLVLATLRERPADASAPAAESNVKFLVEPYLQFATRTQISILWETDAPCTAVVEYGTTVPPKKAAKFDKPAAMG
ncbi:MAG TPA: hypothetical protein VGI99_04315, partial [Gemmataceae bacterium]